jgi:hypothetical protein
MFVKSVVENSDDDELLAAPERPHARAPEGANRAEPKPAPALPIERGTPMWKQAQRVKMPLVESN